MSVPPESRKTVPGAEKPQWSAARRSGQRHWPQRAPEGARTSVAPRGAPPPRPSPRKRGPRAQARTRGKFQQASGGIPPRERERLSAARLPARVPDAAQRETRVPDAAQREAQRNGALRPGHADGSEWMDQNGWIRMPPPAPRRACRRRCRAASIRRIRCRRCRAGSIRRIRCSRLRLRPSSHRARRRA